MLLARTLKLDRVKLIDAVIAAQDAEAQNAPRGVIEARREVVLRAVAPLVHREAKREYLSWSGKLPDSVDYCYVFNAALAGAAHAMRKYDRAKLQNDGSPHAFTTYATKWIKQAAQRAIYSQISSMRVGWERLRTSGPGVTAALSVMQASLDGSARASAGMADNESMFGTDTSAESLVVRRDPGYDAVDDADIAQRIIGAARALSSDVTPQQRARRGRILTLIADGYTTTEIAERVGVTRQRVEQIIDDIEHGLWRAGGPAAIGIA